MENSELNEKITTLEEKVANLEKNCSKNKANFWDYEQIKQIWLT